ncbi:hypothetical protein [Rhizobium tumorigenes]|uniref:hypothetical protein n=1 Tax=Rhizobium tumorigenes TaxID=2041385 RepID=UPI00241C239D|nr:hypothetical protein [Rhizobium tumorigenes]WFS02220.1 hypothetical protein PR016_06295 [Rhizobium tumorigenes]
MTNPYPIPRQDRQSDIFVGDGSSAYGPFDFKIFDVDDVEVWTSALGETGFTLRPSILVLKVADLPLDNFTITFPANQPVTTRIVVRSARLDIRSAGVMNGTRIDPTALEKELSKISTEAQELRRDIDRAVSVDFGGDPLTVAADIDDGDILMKSGGRLVKGPYVADILNAQANAIAAAASALAAHLSELAAASSVARNNFTSDPFIGDGSATDFPLTFDPVSAANVLVFAGGNGQLLSSYSLVNVGGIPKIRFTQAPPASVAGEFRYGNAVGVNVPADLSVTLGKLTTNSVDSSKIVDKSILYGDIQDISATKRLLGRVTAGGGSTEELNDVALRDNFFAPGDVVQTWSASYSINADIVATIPLDDTIPQLSEGALLLSKAITPFKVGNIIRVRWQGRYSVSAGAALIWALFNSIGTDAFEAGYHSGLASTANFTAGEGEYTVTSIAAQTISLRVGLSSGTLRFNGNTTGRFFGGAMKVPLIIEEIKA